MNATDDHRRVRGRTEVVAGNGQGLVDDFFSSNDVTGHVWADGSIPLSRDQP